MRMHFRLFLILILLPLAGSTVVYSASWITLTNGKFITPIAVRTVRVDSVEIEFSRTRIWIAIDSLQYVGRTGGSKFVGGVAGGVTGFLFGGVIGSAVTERGSGHPDLSKLGGAIAGSIVGGILGAIAGTVAVPGEKSHDLSQLSREEKIKLLKSF